MKIGWTGSMSINEALALERIYELANKGVTDREKLDKINRRLSAIIEHCDGPKQELAKELFNEFFYERIQNT